MKRGMLRIYLGYAPGVGKTVAMLDEGQRRKARGTDVVIGYLEPHGRAKVEERSDDFEVVPLRKVEYQARSFEEMDVDAIRVRHPEVALVDELAHSNVPGSRNQKRWQDVNELLDAGITVITTLNIQHLESLHEAVQRVIGIRLRELIPDYVVRQTDQIELVDLSPEALRRRVVHGDVFRRDEVDSALGNYFRESNLTRLRELAVMWLADRVEESLQDYMARHGISEPWETRERVVVAIAGHPYEAHLVERAASIAERRKGELVAVHVTTGAGLKSAVNYVLDELKEVVRQRGGRWRQVEEGDIPEAVLEIAREENATQLVIGASRRGVLGRISRGSVINQVLRDSGAIDIHVIADPDLPAQASGWLGLSPLQRRFSAGALLALIGLPLLTLFLASFEANLGLASITLLSYLTSIVVIAALSGGQFAFLAGMVSILLADYFVIPVRGSIDFWVGESLLAIALFLAIAGGVTLLVQGWSRLGSEARRTRAQAEALLRAVGWLGHEEDPLRTFLDHLRASFGLSGVSVLRQSDDGWTVEAPSGDCAPAEPHEATEVLPLGDGSVLAIAGPPSGVYERDVLAIFIPQVAVAVRNRWLKQRASEASRISSMNELRGAILNAVSHDLRNPLAGIKAAATSLLQQDVDWSSEDTDQFLETIHLETDRLISLVGNLLDVSRIRAGAVGVFLQPSALEEVVLRALASLGDRKGPVVVDLPETLPSVNVDPTLLERAIANIADNAFKWAPPDDPVRVDAYRSNGYVELRIIDKGPGILEADRQRVGQAFERLADSKETLGFGLGLAVARGFVEAMGGRFSMEDTPGGGATVVMALGIVD